MSNQRDKAERLRALHRPGSPLVLVNAWDAASARIVQSLGFPAIGTTSAGIAFLEGFPDGQRIGLVGMLAGVARICRAVSIPVSADLEGGYGESVDDAVATAKGAIAAGAAGLNFEDGVPHAERLVDARLQAERIVAIRRVATDYGVPLVINARTDSFLNGIGAEADRMRETIARGRLYHEAGADCIFVPGVTEPDAIERLARELGVPLNILTNARAPSVQAMGQLGVARLSLGSSAFLTALTALRDLAVDVRDRGTISTSSDVLTYAELNAFFE